MTDRRWPPIQISSKAFGGSVPPAGQIRESATYRSGDCLQVADDAPGANFVAG
jgi:hypothetical protein